MLIHMSSEAAMRQFAIDSLKLSNVERSWYSEGWPPRQLRAGGFSEPLRLDDVQKIGHYRLFNVEK